jgi:excinuclease ABC subunit C
VGEKLFDRKFGADLLREVPAGPAVYLFKDEAGAVLYAGKAKDVRRRLACYRNASRRKAHRKMRRLVKVASSLEVRPQRTERDALLLENELIRTLRPPYNVDGAYTFLYPSIGVGTVGHQTMLAFTTATSEYASLPLRWYGCFRSRRRALAAFDALVALLDRIGHREPRRALPAAPRLRGSRWVGHRRVGAIAPGLEQWLAGESAVVLGALAIALLEKPDAREHAAEVEDDLRLLQDFYDGDTRPLRQVLRAAGRSDPYVTQDERDALFIGHRHPAREGRASRAGAMARSRPSG